MWSRNAVPAGRRRRRGAAAASALAALVGLTGCGFQPLYDPGTPRAAAYGSVAPATTGSVYIAPIRERIGQQLHTNLQRQLNPSGQPRDPDYRLDVQVRSVTEPTNLRTDGTAVRRSLTVRATWALADYDGSAPLVRSAVSVSSSYNVVDQPYATLAAFRDAQERATADLARDIANRVAGYLARRNDGAAAGQP